MTRLYEDDRCIAEKGCFGAPFPVPKCKQELRAVDVASVFRCGDAWNGSVVTVRGRAGLHLDFESQVYTPCGLAGGEIALDENTEPAWPPRPIMERVSGQGITARFRYRQLVDLEHASCEADASGPCCTLAVPIGSILTVRGRLNFSSDDSGAYEGGAKLARIADAALCVVR